MIHASTRTAPASPGGAMLGEGLAPGAPSRAELPLTDLRALAPCLAGPSAGRSGPAARALSAERYRS